jgi:hypothetical protein
MSLVTVQFSKQIKLTLPESLGQALGLQEGDQVEIWRYGQGLWLHPLKKLPFPGSLTNLTHIIPSNQPVGSVDLEPYTNRYNYEQLSGR